MHRLSLSLALLLLLGGRATAEDDGIGDALDGLSGAKALAFVKELAADEMKGRRTGFEGGQKAENWVIARFSECGLHPADAGGAYLEPFTFGASEVTAPIVCKVGDKGLAYGTDFVEVLQTGAGSVTAEVVFCGYGMVRPDLGWNDYEGVDVKGKIVLALRGAPRARAADFGAGRTIGYKAKTAADMGAAALLLVDGERALVGTILPRFVRPKLPALWLSQAAADSILAGKQKSIAKLKSQRDAGNPAKSFSTGTRVTIDLKTKWHARAQGHNALGALPGRDPDLKHEIVLVCAHMDHVGTGPDGTVFDGADDNASGTAVLTHLADVLTANRWKPKRTIIFCAFGAKEQGLIGSRALANRYPFEGRIVCVLNVDMVGQGAAAVRIAGGGSYPAMEQRLKDYLPKALAENTSFAPRAGESGDHWPFYERGIPAFFISTKGKHAGYHTASDDVENIEPACLEAAARTVGTLLVKLGNCTEKLEVPGGFYHYLLHEGPVFGMWRVEGESLHGPSIDGTTHTGQIVTVPLGTSPESAWKLLESFEASENGTTRLVRRASDVGRAWREGKQPVIARLEYDLREDPSHVAQLAGIGYRWIAPFGVSPAIDDGKIAAIVKACRAARALVEIGGEPKEMQAAISHLGAWPSVMLRPKSPEDPELGRGGNVLFLVGGLDAGQMIARLGVDPQVLVTGLKWKGRGGDPVSLAKALGEWQSTTKPGWWLPGTAERKAIRAVLGGRLVEWLQRAERSP